MADPVLPTNADLAEMIAALEAEVRQGLDDLLSMLARMYPRCAQFHDGAQCMLAPGHPLGHQFPL